jgi:hypothetical protein
MDILPKYLFMSVPHYQQNNILPEQLIYLHNPAYANQAVTLPLIQPSKPMQQNTTTAATITTSSLVEHQQQHATSGYKTCCQPSAALVNSSVSQRGMTITGDELRRHQHHQPDGTHANGTSSSSQNQLAIQLRQPPPPPQELDAANLLAGSSSLQSRPTTFLPYLQSEAARRLQLQRSRSSEKDSKSFSGNQPSNGAGAGGNNNGHQSSVAGGLAPPDAGGESSKAGTGAQSASSTSAVVRQGAVDGRQRRRRSRATKSANPIWRLIRPHKSGESNRADNDPESNREQQQHQLRPVHSGGQQQPRHSRSSSTTSSALVRQGDDDDDDDDDDYRHHRHFQARASICSNNLWRIGPTRRCSLAVPMANYPSYYRPLAQFQQQQRGSGSGAGSLLNTISGSSLPPIVAHYHINGHHHHHHQDDDSEASSTSSSDGHAHSHYKSGAAIAGLISQTTNLAVDPERIFGDSSRSGRQLEMGSMTSGGFISNSVQGQRGVNAIPPRRSVTPSSFQSEPQNSLPTPPPPLPPADFSESPPMLDVARPASSRVNNFYDHQQGPLCNLMLSSRRLAPEHDSRTHMSLIGHESYPDQVESSSSVATTTIQQHPRYLQAHEDAYRQSDVPMMVDHHVYQAQQQQQQRPRHVPMARSISNNHRAALNDIGGLRVAPNPPPAAAYQCGPYLSPIDHHHHHHHQSMPRSRSTDQRLSSATDMLTANGQRLFQHGQQQNYPAYAGNERQQLKHSQTMLDNLDARRQLQQQQQQHSIGRQLGQAYIQRLQRQPAIYSLQHQSRTMLPFNKNALAMANLVAGQAKQQQQSALLNRAHYPTQLSEPSIDMLRRCKSQTSLNRKVAAGCSLNSTDCGHCAAEAVLMSSKRAALAAANQLCSTTSRAGHRPQSESRARLNSAGGHRSERLDVCPGPAGHDYRQCRGGFDVVEADGKASHCAPAFVKTMPAAERAKSYSLADDKSGCRCSALVGGGSGSGSGSGGGESTVARPQQGAGQQQQPSTLDLLKLINEVDKAIQNAMFIAQHIDNLDEFESVSGVQSEVDV